MVRLASIRGHDMNLVPLITIAGTIAIITTTTTDRSGNGAARRPYHMQEGGDGVTSIIVPLV